MASVKDFCSQLESLDGVEQYLLIATDGQIVVHSIHDPDRASSLMTLTSLAAEKIRKHVETGRLRTMFLGLSEERGLMIFALGKWILGIQKQPGCAIDDLSRQVESVINNFRNP